MENVNVEPLLHLYTNTTVVWKHVGDRITGTRQRCVRHERYEQYGNLFPQVSLVASNTGAHMKRNATVATQGHH